MLTDGQPTKDVTLNSNLEDYDQDCTSAAETAGGYTCDSDDRKSNVSYVSTDGSSDHWDDVAQALFEIDLRPDLDDANSNEVVNNVTTYTIGFADDQVRNHPLIQQTADQGGGEFIFADNADDLRLAFESATQSIIAQSSTSAAVTFNSSTLSSQTAVYQALFNTVRWSGELKSIPLNGFTGALLTNCTAGTDNCWSAAAQLDGQSAGSRVILTYNPDDTTTPANKAGVVFNNPTDYQSLGNTTVPQALIDDLCATPVPTPIPVRLTTYDDRSGEIAANQSFISAMINYLRGDRSNEGSSGTYDFRTRTHVLGDLVNANPVYVSKPASNWPNRPPFPEPPVDITDPNPSYSAFLSANINRTGIVYAPANDGMLHGFRTTESSSGAGDAGNEVFAYIPTGTFSSSSLKGCIIWRIPLTAPFLQ